MALGKPNPRGKKIDKPSGTGPRFGSPLIYVLLLLVGFLLLRSLFQDAGFQRVELDSVRRFQFQHHDGDDDGQHAIAERFKSVFAHERSVSKLVAGPNGSVIHGFSTVLADGPTDETVRVARRKLRMPPAGGLFPQSPRG